MPSSPEPTAPVAAMPLDELAPRRAARRAGPSQLFEVACHRTDSVTHDAVAADRAAAQAAGYAAGWSNGMRAAKAVAEAEADAARAAAEHAARLTQHRWQQAFQALETAAQRLEHSLAPNADALTETILEAAFAIAESLVGHDMRTHPDRAEDALARVLALVPEGEDVTVRLSPADHATLTSGPRAGTSRRVQLVADPTLQPGDAIANSGATLIDARIRAGVQRVRASLGLEGGGA